MTENYIDDDLDAAESATLIIKLQKDIAAAARLMSRREARYLVDIYYQIQRQRVAAAGQVRSMTTAPDAEPVETLKFIGGQARVLELQAQRALDLWTRDHPVSQWQRSIVGIGPVISAGFRAHLDEDPPATVGHWWRFAGVDPTVVWKKGEKRPWNAKLKTLLWKASTSFVKFQGNDADVYGKLYLQRKAYEVEKNDRGEYAAQAAVGAARVGKSTEAYGHYSQGRLSPGHLHSRALRWTIKLHMSHYHECAYFLRHGTLPPLPYALGPLAHAHEIPPPHMDLVPGWVEARQAAQK